MKTSRIILLAGLLVATVAPAAAQREPRYTIAVQPFHWLNGTTRLDFEKRLDERHWMQVGLSVHALTKHDDATTWTMYAGDEEITRLRGAGTGFKYKYFFSRWVYYATGAEYHHYRVRYLDNAMHTYREDDLTFHEYLTGIDARQNFNKLSATFTVGLQSSVRRVFFVDVFAGLGCAYSFFNGKKKPFDDTVFSFGYRGIFPTGGFRAGIAF